MNCVVKFCSTYRLSTIMILGDAFQAEVKDNKSKIFLQVLPFLLRHVEE